MSERLSYGRHLIGDIPASYPSDKVTYGAGTVKDALDGKVNASGDTMSGNLTIDRQNGTSDTVGVSQIVLGNNTSVGTVGNSIGALTLYGDGASRISLQARNASGNKTIQLPDASGTIALTNINNRFTASQVIDKADGTASALGTSQLTLGNSTPEGTAGNSYGQLIVYGKGDNYVSLRANLATGDRTIQFPNSSGTLALTNTNNNFVSNQTIDRADGTTEADGESTLCIGNSTASGTAGNSRGRIRIYSTTTKYVDLRAADGLSSNRAIYLPNKDGTIALTSDIPTASASATANTVALRNSSGYLYAVYYNASNAAENINSYTSYAMFKDSSGWQRCTSRLNFAQWLTNSNVTSPGHVVSLTDGWNSFGYTTLAQLKTAMALNNVNNTADANKSVNYANSAGKAFGLNYISKSSGSDTAIAFTVNATSGVGYFVAVGDANGTPVLGVACWHNNGRSGWSFAGSTQWTGSWLPSSSSIGCKLNVNQWATIWIFSNFSIS